MNIVKVSMIGANEKLPAADVIDFLRAYPQAEIGIGVSAQKGEIGTPRFNYVMSLMKQYNEKYVPGKMGTIALHINGNGKDGVDGWPYIVSSFKMPLALYKMMNFPDMSVQLNHMGYDFEPRKGKFFAHCYVLHNLIAPKARLILSYCDKTAGFINEFMDVAWAKVATNKLKCDILYDASFGNSKMAKSYAAPLYDGVRQGYAGGFGPDNILDELPKIQATQTDPNAEIWIDAEGKLQNDAKTTLDLTRAEAFYKKIMDYQKHK